MRTSQGELTWLLDKSCVAYQGEPHQIYQVQLIGDDGAGKNNLILKLADPSFEFTGSYISTIGSDFKDKDIFFEDQLIRIRLHVFLRSYVRGRYPRDGYPRDKYTGLPLYKSRKHAYLLVFDMHDWTSINNIKEWLKEIPEDKIIMLVGTKSDIACVEYVSLNDRRESIKSIIDSANADSIRICGYMETSVKTGNNIDLILPEIVKAIQQKDRAIQEQEREFRSLAPTKALLIGRLENYLKRIESHKIFNTQLLTPLTSGINIKGGLQPDFSYGFTFFRKSRAINREINYLLALSLLEKLKESTTLNEVERIFNNIDTERRRIIADGQIDEREHYRNRGMNSKELNQIIKLTK